MSIDLKNHGLFDIDVDIDVDVDIDIGRGLEHESVLQVAPIEQKKFFFWKIKVNWHMTKDNYLEKEVNIAKNKRNMYPCVFLIEKNSWIHLDVLLALRTVTLFRKISFFLTPALRTLSILMGGRVQWKVKIAK